MIITTTALFVTLRKVVCLGVHKEVQGIIVTPENGAECDTEAIECLQWQLPCLAWSLVGRPKGAGDQRFLLTLC